MDNSHRKGTFVPVSPSQTLQSSDRSSKGSNDCSNISSNKQGVNIQVIVRCRPLNDDEKRVNTPAMVTCNEQRREVSSVQNIANKKIDKTFTFDKVFGPSSQQSNLFEQAVSPIVREVLEGYNCTIFAYGQTGTGKTYTMEGGASKAKINGKFPRDAGVIPRSVRQIFDKLESQNAEYSVKVTFLELYNEEITDLLAPEELRILDDKSKKPIALMEDGKGGVFVRGLEEEIVTSASEIYEILEKGSLKRRTAETLLNKQSSRSHSIFSITIHIKECTPEGEEMIKCGKLNLVDLAGSENISRSGARDNRAREAGEINKSLLTLGRVINALVDHSGHIPYRDSKLTRLLRDSLGGKTKTCIIATISPSIHCLEETLNTLDYAHRAKNIKNKPEINQKMMKSAMIKDLYFEIDRLKQELYAAREKNGVYIPKDFFLQDEALKKATSDKMGSLEVQLELRDKELVALQDLFNSEKLLNADLSDKLEKTKRQLDEKEHSFSELEQRYEQANFAIKEKQYLISNLLKSEKVLLENALELRSGLESTAEDISVLFSKIARKNKIEDGNKVLLQKFTSQLAEQVGLLHKNVSTSVTQQETHLIQLEEEMRSFISAKIKNTKELHGWLERLEDVFSSGIKSMEGVAAELKINSHSTFEKFNSKISTHSYELGDFFKNIAFEGNHLLNELKGILTMMEDKLSSFSRKQHEGHLSTLEASRSISKIIASFFCNLDAYATKINKILVEAETVRNKQLQDLEKKLEENAANEKIQFLAKVEEMIENSNSKKKKLVQDAVYSLQKTDGERTSSLLGELSYAQNFTHEMKDEWNLYMLETEKNYHEDTTTIESERMVIEKGLHDCQTMTTSGLQKWDTSCSSLLTLEQSNLSSMESLVKSGMEANDLIHSISSSILLTTLQNNESAYKCLLSSIDGSLNLDHKTCENIGSFVIPCRAGLRELQIGHHHSTAGITESAQNCLEKEYMVDEEAHLTPRIINVPTVANIEELRTPAFEELLKSWEAKPDLNKQVSAEGKQFFGSNETQGQHLPKDFRTPLTLRN